LRLFTSLGSVGKKGVAGRNFDVAIMIFNFGKLLKKNLIAQN